VGDRETCNINQRPSAAGSKQVELTIELKNPNGTGIGHIKILCCIKSQQRIFVTQISF
jgi:hypothetical protein